MAGEGQWSIVFHSEIGASHVRSGTVNQDAIGAWTDARDGAERFILAAADGHGSASSFRSHLGARWAVDLALDGLSGLLERSLDDQRRHLEPNSSLHQHSAIAHAFQLALKGVWEKWTRRVRSDGEERPFAQEDLERLSSRQRRDLERNMMVAYGATLLVVAGTPDFTAYAQLGDGDLLIVAPDGAVRRPMRDDPRMLGNDTLSMCQKNAWVEFRIAVVPRVEETPALVMVSTDGYKNSFASEEGFEQAAADFLRMIGEASIEEVARHLPEWLKETTASGSGDDISVGLLCNLGPRTQGAREALPRPSQVGIDYSADANQRANQQSRFMAGEDTSQAASVVEPTPGDAPPVDSAASITAGSTTPFDEAMIGSAAPSPILEQATQPEPVREPAEDEA